MDCSLCPTVLPYPLPSTGHSTTTFLQGPRTRAAARGGAGTAGVGAGGRGVSRRMDSRAVAAEAADLVS